MKCTWIFTIILLIVSSIPGVLKAQTSLKNIRKKSYQVFLFTIKASDAEKFILQDSIPIDMFAGLAPAYTFPSALIDIDSLQKGYYVALHVEGENLVAGIIERSDLVVYPVNNKFNIQLAIRKKDGTFVPDADVWVNGKKATYNKDGGTYWAKQKKLDEAFVRICAPGDTCFLELDQDDRDYWSDRDIAPPLQQRWSHFKTTGSGKVLTWIPRKFGSILNRKNHSPSQNTGATGYVLFNQPKYKLTDTVRLKAYIVNKKWKQVVEKLDLFLEYYSRGKHNKQLLTRLSPASPGSYVYSFPLNDTLASDTRYNIVFRNANGKRVISKEFSTEDYLLDEVSSYEFRADKSSYYKNDTMFFYATAKDANNLPVLDENVNLLLATHEIKGFYNDTISIPDTLYLQSKKLEVDGETIFKIPVNDLPRADLQISAQLQFRNSNNETHDEECTILYSYKSQHLNVTAIEDSVFTEYIADGKSVETNGIVNIRSDMIDMTLPVRYPVRMKTDPLAKYYDFSVYDRNDSISKHLSIDSYYTVEFSRISKEDTLGFLLTNPYRIPVTYMVLDGNRVISTGKSEEQEIRWSMVAASKRKIYMLKWQYMWAGEQKEGQENMAVLYKLLKINVKNTPKVFPGQRDTIDIQVNDYMNKPAEGVNLSAVAYNSQFRKNISVREPPYLLTYRSRLSLIRQVSELFPQDLSKKYPLGDHQRWIGRFGLDTMPFYKILFPTSYPFDVVTHIDKPVPEISVHIVKKGRPQEVYLLYINRRLAFYNGVTDISTYAFPTAPGYTQIAVRLKDQYLEMDSIYVQPYYKHDIVIDLDSLPAHSKILSRPAYWTEEERSLIENSIWQLTTPSSIRSGYVWQSDRLTKISEQTKHLIGPFIQGEKLHYFAPEKFDIEFDFEAGYKYNLSPKKARLEKNPVFPVDVQKIYLPKTDHYTLRPGDTTLPVPEIAYPKKITPAPYIDLKMHDSYNLDNYNYGKGNLQFEIPKDTLLKYVILYNADTLYTNRVMDGTVRNITGIRPGEYSLLLVNNEFKAAEIKRLVVVKGYTLCVNANALHYIKDHPLVSQMVRESMDADVPRIPLPTRVKAVPGGVSLSASYPRGNCSIIGTITDSKGGHGIAGASIVIKGTGAGVSASNDGSFSIKNIKEGEYVLFVASVGYVSREVNVHVINGQVFILNTSLNILESSLNEVVVTGFATTQKKSMTGAVATVVAKELSGSVAGVYVQEAESFVMGEKILQPDINDPVALRSDFKDYAFWQPELFTNQDGSASFEVKYPDNVTGWEIYVLAMDKKRRMGKGVGFTKAYKPVMSQLNVPQFLVAGDSALLVAKASNYTKTPIAIQSSFKADGRLFSQPDTLLPAEASLTSFFPIRSANNPENDTLVASFALKTSSGFNDGEERKIPLFKKGTEEANGHFYVLQKDTALTFSPQGDGPVEIYAQNNTLDILLNEIDHLKQYPYFCMEQTASKLKGLLAEQRIRETLKQPFNNGKELNRLTKKIQESQLLDGGWSWWGNGHASIPVTIYIIEALLPLRKDPLIESNIRNGLLYLQNQLMAAGISRAVLNKREVQLQILSCFSEASHSIDYALYLSNIPFDSLNQYQQWQWVRICQQQGLPYASGLEHLLKQQTGNMTGGVHWGEETYRWYNNTMAATLLAYKVLQQDKKYPSLLTGIIQYFLGRRHNSYWANTVESASVVATVLPEILAMNVSFDRPAGISINGDTSFTISSFPYAATIPATKAGKLTIQKTGGGISYLTLYQKWWNPVPKAVTGNFNIRTYFQMNNGSKVESSGEGLSFDNISREKITAGGKMKMIVKVDLIKDADYVMIEIPIPAGCNYSSKEQDDWQIHKEFLKNKVMLFAEFLKKGEHVFEIELEPRYKGRFTLNPAKAGLMYFPTFYGRNAMRQVDIQ